MLGIDTNVLVRYLVADDEAQFDKARRLIRRETAAGRKLMVSLLVLLETEWVLRSRYGYGKAAFAEILSGLLDAADCLIGARNRRLGCTATATFDVRAARLPGFIKT